MEFIINNRHWEIIEETQEKIKLIQQERKAMEDENIKAINIRYYGVTYCDWLKIYIDKDLPLDRKKTTLLHELEHCYIDSFITHEDKQYSEEDVADIFSNSYEIITKIYNIYFQLESR